MIGETTEWTLRLLVELLIFVIIARAAQTVRYDISGGFVISSSCRHIRRTGKQINPPGAAGTAIAPPRRIVTSAGKSLSLVLGYNAALLTAEAHRDELDALVAKCKLKGAWDRENDGDALLAALRRGAATFTTSP